MRETDSERRVFAVVLMAMAAVFDPIVRLVVHATRCLVALRHVATAKVIAVRDDLATWQKELQAISDWQWEFAHAWARQNGFMADGRGQGTNMVGLFIGLMVAAIVVVRVFIPVVNDAINDSNVSGTEADILGLLGLFASLLLLVALAGPLMQRV